MVNGIEANYAANQVPQQVYTTAPQTVVNAGAQAAEQLPDTFLSSTKNAASSAAIFEGIPILNLLLRSKKSTGKALSQGMNLIGLHNKTALKKLLHGDGKLSKRILDFVSSANKSKQAYMTERSSVKALSKSVKATKKLEKITKKLSQAAENNAGKLKKGILEFSKKHIQGKAIKAEAKAVDMASKAETARTVINSTQAVGKAAGKLGSVRNFLKSSGAGIMLVFSGIAECISEVIPTFKELGAKKGFKQIGKSSVKVLGDTVGFIGGEQAGVALGTAIGTAICPGIGSAVGAVCGLVGGFVGSWVMGKVTKAITGKSERELAKEQQQQQEVQKNPFEEFEQYQLNPYFA